MAKAQGKAPTEPATESTDVELYTSELDDDALASIKSFDDLGKLTSTGDVNAVDLSDYGTGFTVIEDKEELVGVDMAIVSWRFHDGDYGQMVILHVITHDGRKWIVNDGSSGICKQMTGIVKRLPRSDKPTVIRVPNGLTVSEYTYKDDAGKEHPAKTFYLSF